MPRGRWGARFGGGAEMGGAWPRRIARFLEPCLLLLLREDASHGYNLLDELHRFGFAAGSLDPSIVYRVLREMEQNGWVVSAWDTTGSRPPRRIYRVTAAGEEYLRRWIADLEQTQAEIDRFLSAYRQQEARDGRRGKGGK